MSPVPVTRARRRLPAASKVVAALAVLAVAASGCAGGAGATVELPQTGAAATPATLDQRDVDAWLDQVLPPMLEEAEIEGAAVAVVHEGEILTARGFGHADTGADGGEPVPVDPERTLLRPGSVSKLFTATAVMQLVERGELDLDTDISQYLDFDLDRRFDGDITVRHLLSHTAGFEQRISGLILPEGATVDLRETLATNQPRQLYAPGTVPAYSNYGSGLAGYIVERVSGLPFDDYLDQHIFAPAGMASSSFRQPLPAELADRMSRGYPRAGDPAGPFEVVSLPPAGALSAPATDLARFMLAHLGELPGDAALLDEATRAEMHSAALGEESLGTLADAPRMTLGFFDESRNGRRIIGHGGDTLYFHTHLQLYPAERTGIFLVMNSTGTSEVHNVRLRMAFMEGFADRYFPPVGAQEKPTVDDEAARQYAEAVAGTYQSSAGFQSNFLSVGRLMQPVRVTALDDGRLRFEPDPGTFAPAVYEAISPTVWREVDGQRTIAVRTVDGDTVIAYDSAFALVPADSSDPLALPTLIGSLLVLLVAALAWPITAAVRRLRRRPAPQRQGRLAWLLTRVAVVSALVGAVSWVTVIMSVSNLQDVPAVAIRLAQLFLLVGAAGMVPAVIRLIGGIRHRHGWRPITGSVLVLLALSGLTSFALQFHLLSPNIAY